MNVRIHVACPVQLRRGARRKTEAGRESTVEITSNRMRLAWRGNHMSSGVTPNEPAHAIMVLFVLRKLILQTRMRSHPVGLDV